MCSCGDWDWLFDVGETGDVRVERPCLLSREICGLSTLKHEPGTYHPLSTSLTTMACHAKIERLPTYERILLIGAAHHVQRSREACSPLPP
jgi:hypothetical protein